jgi:hypothetical protein
MRVAPVSADLLIKLALAAAVVGGAWYLATRARAAIDGVLPDWSLPDVGAWVDGAGRFVGDVGTTIGDGAGYVADTFGGTAHNTMPNYDMGSSPEWNPYGIALTPAQRDVYDTTVERGTIFGDAWDWLARIGNQVPPGYGAPDVGIGYGGIDARRIDRQLGY